MTKKILLIEDEDLIRDLYKRQLEQGGITTDAVANGTEGLKALQENNYDLVLLDIMLPDKNGLEVLITMKQDKLTKEIPVVMLTNLGQDSVIKEAFKLGAISYLLKASFTPDQMVQEVQKILNQQESSSTPPQSQQS